VKIRQIAPNAISGSYTFDMHKPSRTTPHAGASQHPKGAAAEAGPPRPVSDPGTGMNEGADTTPRSTNKLHRRSRSAVDSRPASNPFTFRVLKRTTSPAFTPPKEELAVVDAPEPRPERRRSFGTTFSFLQPWHRRDRLGSRSSESSTNSGSSNSGSEDGEAAEPGSGSGSESVPAVPEEKQSLPQASTTRHSAGLYFPIGQPEPTLASNDGPTTPADVVPPSPPILAQAGYHKAQTKKVLKHARAELMKEVSKAGYNVLVVEGSVFSFALFPFLFLWEGRY
jgi:hypothetical protein